MDILDFLNSKDVANYLKEINYGLSPVEMAYIVYHSNHHTLAQKREAWGHIAQTFPDAVYGKANIGFKKKPLSEYIKDYIKLQDSLIAQCKVQDNAVWEYAFKSDEGENWGTILKLVKIFLTFHRLKNVFSTYMAGRQIQSICTENLHTYE